MLEYRRFFLQYDQHHSCIMCVSSKGPVISEHHWKVSIIFMNFIFFIYVFNINSSILPTMVSVSVNDAERIIILYKAQLTLTAAWELSFSFCTWYSIKLQFSSKEFSKVNLIQWLFINLPNRTSTFCNVVISCPLRMDVNVCLTHQTIGLPAFLDTESSEIDSLRQKELFNNQDSSSHDAELYHGVRVDQKLPLHYLLSI